MKENKENKRNNFSLFTKPKSRPKPKVNEALKIVRADPIFKDLPHLVFFEILKQLSLPDIAALLRLNKETRRILSGTSSNLLANLTWHHFMKQEFNDTENFNKNTAYKERFKEKLEENLMTRDSFVEYLCSQKIKTIKNQPFYLSKITSLNKNVRFFQRLIIQNDSFLEFADESIRYDASLVFLRLANRPKLVETFPENIIETYALSDFKKYITQLKNYECYSDPHGAGTKKMIKELTLEFCSKEVCKYVDEILSFKVDVNSSMVYTTEQKQGKCMIF